jgi:acetate kinase
MKKVLVLNCGSSSIKYALFVKGKEVLRCDLVVGKRTYLLLIREIVKKLISSGHISDVKDIIAVGHRVVHGGDFTKSAVVNASVIKVIKKFAKIAPLHNPHNLEGIMVCNKLFPHAKQVAVFDTAFHTSISEEKRTYPLPHSLSKKHHVKSYGFHGQSYQYIYGELKKLHALGKVKNIKKVIVCHLGSGCSICAIKKGKSFDVSSGMTTFSGIPMATRCGDIDVGIIPYLVKSTGKSLSSVMHMLDHQSGVYGLSGFKDMRDIAKRYRKNKKCRLAVDVFCYHVKKWLCSYVGLMGGVDTIVFTAGVGEHSALVRSKVLSGLEFFPLKIDEKKNKKNSLIISSRGSHVQVLVIPTDEEKLIYEEVRSLI